MRRKFNPQLNLFTTMARTQIAKELQHMSQVLDDTPKVLWVWSIWYFKGNIGKGEGFWRLK